jgi:fatty-acyl-CoA synthase
MGEGVTDRMARAGARTTAQMLADAADAWPDRLALRLDDARLTWAGLLAEATLYARGLLALGVGPGSHVGILMPNSVDYVRLVYAAGMIGANALTINARFGEAELAHVIGHSDADALFIGGHALPHQDIRAALTRVFPALEHWDGGPLALPEAPRLKRIVNLADPRETRWPTGADFLAGAQTVPKGDARALIAAGKPDTPALMMYSSGTTARPKACILTHRMLNTIGAAFADRFGLTPDDRIMNPLPFFHLSTMLPMAAARASGAAQLCTARFTPGATLDVMEAERATFAYLSFPTLINQVIAHETFPARDLASLRYLHAVGPADLMRRYAATFPRLRYINAYGLTEATGVPVWTDPADPPEDAPEVNGRPLPGLSVKAIHPDTGEDLPPGTQGELAIKGWSVFAGYYKDPAATAATFTPDGWLRTGDAGHVDAMGRVIYGGRIKDMLKIGGENVAALEIETHLCTHPAIQVAQVIGVPDDHLGEVAAAFVELVPGASLTPEDVVRHCTGRLARYKVPRYVRIVTDWPMSATKIQKFRLPRDFTPADRIDPPARP